MEKRLKVENISKKKKPVLTRNMFNNPYEIHQYIRLKKRIGNPVCVICKYQWYDIFLKTRGQVYGKRI